MTLLAPLLVKSLTHFILKHKLCKKVLHYMFRPIWLSSNVKTLVVLKLLLPIWSYFLWGPLYVLVYPLMVGCCPCVACVPL
jgi:hypothetical protein